MGPFLLELGTHMEPLDILLLGQTEPNFCHLNKATNVNLHLFNNYHNIYVIATLALIMASMAKIQEGHQLCNNINYWFFFNANINYFHKTSSKK